MANGDQSSEQELERYRDDVRTIREVLMSVDRQPLFANWVFYSWGLILIAGAVSHFLVSRRLVWDAASEFIRIWVPLISAGLVLETTAYVQNTRRLALSFWSRDFVRVVFGMLGSSAVLVFLVLLLFAAGVANLVPTVLLLGLAVFYFLFGQHASYGHFTHLGFVALVAAVLLYFLHPDRAAAGLICGLVAGLSMITAGVIGGRTLHSV